jgi:hypothetical protein
MTGDYIFLIKNLDFGCWYIGEMSHRFVKSGGTIDEKVQYKCCGEFNISENLSDGTFSAVCTCSGGECCRGVRTKVFDSFNVRKELGYHTTMRVIYKSFGLKLL